MRIEQVNEAVVRRFYELWNRWRLDLAEEIVSPTVRFRGSLGTSLVGREELKGYARAVRDAFPDWHNRIEEVVSAGDRVVTRLS